MEKEKAKNDLNLVGGSDERHDEIHAVVTYLDVGVYYENMLWGDYTTVRYEDNFFDRLLIGGCNIFDIRLFRTSEEAKAYLDVIEREFMEKSVYGKKFYFETGTETLQPLRVSDGIEDVLLELRLFQSHEDKGERLSIDDTTALVPVPLLRIDNGHVTFREDKCKENVKKILSEMVYCYADVEEQEDYNEY